MKQVTFFLTILYLATFSSDAQNDKWSGSLNNYSIDLYNQLKTENKNLFYSPLSTYYALLMGYEGAQNKTKQAFEKVLHIESNCNISDFSSFSKNLIKWKDLSNNIQISNIIWFQRGLSLDTDYTNRVIQDFTSDIKTVDFREKPEVSNEINEWISKNSNGLIQNMVSPEEINDSTNMFITNAIYFTGKWSKEFNTEYTKPKIFNAIDKTKKMIEFMNTYEFMSYYENSDFQFIAKNYIGNDKSFCIILPKKRYGLVGVEKTFSSTVLNQILDNAKTEYVKISMPKFKIETNYSLIKSLITLGLGEACIPVADFSGITTEVPLMFNQINHKAFIEITEKKTEAAGITNLSIMVGRSLQDLPKPNIFNADHPFIFLIIDNKTKSIIFIGRYVTPE